TWISISCRPFITPRTALCSTEWRLKIKGGWGAMEDTAVGYLLFYMYYLLVEDGEKHPMCELRLNAFLSERAWEILGYQLETQTLVCSRTTCVFDTCDDTAFVVVGRG
ncbi:unnamed protein product, partial [Choristocarpus tenellus]